MPSLKTLLAVCILVAMSFSCHNTSPLIAKDLTHENERNNTLFVFVGEKIAVKEIPYNGQMMGGALVTAKYKILQRVYGNYVEDTIEFEAYDHYGEFPFAKYKNVLMFVSKGKQTGKYYQEEYQYFDVYKTKSGRWASSYKAHEYQDTLMYYTAVKPEKIDFAEEVSYPTKIKDYNGKEISVHYPEKYYKIVGEKAVAVYGNYVEELFRLKKEGVLTARQLFGDKKSESEDEQQYVLANPEPMPPNKTDKKFTHFWNSFYTSIKKAGPTKFKEMVCDSLWCGELVATAEQFYKNCFYYVFDDELIKKCPDTLVNFSSTQVGSSGILLCAAKRIIKDNNDYIVRHVEVTRLENEKQPWIVTFDFIKTDDGYKLYGYHYSDGWDNCP